MTDAVMAEMAAFDRAKRSAARWKRARKVLIALGIAGMPMVSSLFTAGLTETRAWVGIWIVTVLQGWVWGFIYLPILGIIAMPLLWLVEHFWPRVARWITDAGAPIVTGAVVIGSVAFEGAGMAQDVELPVQPPGVGLVLVMAASAAAMAPVFLASVWARRKSERIMKDAFAARRVARGLAAQGVLPLPEAPDLEVSEVALIGWRGWAWNGEVLHGYRVPWKSSQLVARCQERHVAPDWACTCGIYATKEPDPAPWAAMSVRGLVEMWGTVIEHEDGYRASHARITDLWADHDEALFLDLTVRYPDVRVWMGNYNEPREEDT